MTRIEGQSKNDLEKEQARARVRISKQRLSKAGINQKAFSDETAEGRPTSVNNNSREKLRKDVVDKLFQRGALDRIHVSAAQEIEDRKSVV